MKYEQFAEDVGVQDKIGFNLIVLGEAEKHVPEDIEHEYPNIDWALMRGMRNRIAHEYNQIDTEIVWKTIQEDLPPMIPILKQILEKYPPDSQNKKA